LTNLAANGQVDRRELASFAKLLSNLRLDPSLAQRVASQIALTQDKVIAGPQQPGQPGQPGDAPNPPNPSEKSDSLSTIANSEVQFLKFSQIDDLLAIPGFSAANIVRLRNFVTVLPVPTKINVNTTSAEVLSARLENVSLTDAALMIATRDRAYFLDFERFKLNFPEKVTEADVKFLDFQTNFFVVNGRVRLNKSLLEVDALIERDDKGTQILWVREN
jgi:general secretion pathway protein K